MNIMSTVAAVLQTLGGIAALITCGIAIYMLYKFLTDYSTLKVMMLNMYNALSPIFKGHLMDFQDEEFNEAYKEEVANVTDSDEDDQEDESDEDSEEDDDFSEENTTEENLTDRITAAKKLFDLNVNRR
jgi:hypothetical protein